MDETQSMAVHTKDIEQYFSVVLFVILYKGVLTLESVDDISSVTIHY